MDSPASVADERVLVLTPTGKDGQLTSEILTRAGFSCRACRRPEELEYEMAAGVGVAILAEEALTSTFMTQLVRMLHTQPPWSDLPLVVFTQHNEGIEILLNMLGRLGNVTVLERPVRITTLLSAVRSGLRGRRRQYELRDLLERLEEADRRKDDFLAMLGHELRNPLAAIQNALNVLTYSASPDPQRRKQHAIIDRQICHLCRIVDDLLDVTRITKGKVVLKREVVDLREIVDRSVQTLTSSEKSERHSVTVIKSAGNLTISGDPVRLEQIVGNLLSNAAKYTPEGGTIELRLTREGSDAVFRVADNGVGIPEEMLPRIFEPFMQVEHSLERAQGGLGLGLPLVRSLVDLHEGSIRVNSEGPGRGSEFVVRFPLAEADAEPASLRSMEDTPANDADGPAHRIVKSLRVLVIEDNDDGRETMQELLQLLGHEVDLAGDGLSGIEKAFAGKPHLALVDIGLPGCDGYEVARRIRRECTGQPPWLVALTGYGQPEDRRRALEAGFDRHLVKPVSYEELSELLHDVEMDRPRSSGELAARP